RSPLVPVRRVEVVVDGDHAVAEHHLEYVAVDGHAAHGMLASCSASSTASPRSSAIQSFATSTSTPAAAIRSSGLSAVSQTSGFPAWNDRLNDRIPLSWSCVVT